MPQVRLNNIQRLEICQHKAKNLKMSQIVLEKWATSKFGANSSNPVFHLSYTQEAHRSRIHDRNELFAKRPRTAHNLNLEDALSTCVLQCQTRNVSLTREIIDVKAKVFYQRLDPFRGTITFSSGCL